jgi:predicted Zn-dependent protease
MILEKDVALARKARPMDPVVRWLTAELMIFIGTEPELILPHLQSAIEGGVDRPRLLASLARTEMEANQLAKAYQSAGKALDRDNHDRYVWMAFGQAAFHTEHFAEVIERLERAFPEQKPDWVKAPPPQCRGIPGPLANGAKAPAR